MKSFDVEINSKPQLLDLNQDLVNFDMTFKVNSENETPFQALVLSKSELDKYQDIKDIEMKEAPGFIKGNITANDNTYENYFLILKKNDGVTKAMVELEIEELKSSTEETLNDNNVVVENNNQNIFSFYDQYFYHIIFVLILSLACFYAYNYMKTKKTKLNKDTIIPSSEKSVISSTESLANNMPTKVKEYLDGIEDL